MNALPPSLDEFGAELENAVGRDLRNRRRHRRAVRGAVALAVVAAAALGLLSIFGSDGPSVVDRAAAALQTSDNSILHYRFDATQQNGDGTTATWNQETWQLRVAPFTRRQISVDGTDGIRAESVSSGDDNELYDSSNDTIYITTSEALRAARMPNFKIVSKSKLEKLTGNPKITAAFVIRKNGDTAHPTVIATKQGAKRVLKEMTHEGQASSAVLPEEFRSEILALLNSGQVQVIGHVTVDGRDAIKLESLDGKKTYIVDAATYDPIEWTTRGTNGGVTYRFSAYEELPVDAQSMQLLDLQDQHPSATVDRDVKAYVAAESRLYPHG
jgi:outer membrane lipoprotein-sorting protein